MLKIDIFLLPTVSFQPGEFIHTIGDTHVYQNHVDELKVQLMRECYKFPTVRFETGGDGESLTTIDDYKAEHIILENYKCHDSIKLPMAL